MKKLLYIFLLQIILLSPFTASAQYAVFDLAAQQTRIVQLAKEVITSVTTVDKFYWDKLLLALETAISIFISQLIDRFTQDTINWINSGFQGGGPAYIVNPNAYFKNVANRQMEQELAGIQKTGNIFGDAIIGTAIQGVRTGRLPTGKQLNYTLGNTVQQSLCNEANLTRIATQQVDSGLTVGPYNRDGREASRNAQIAQKRQLLYTQMCSRSPNGNVNMQKSLTNCFAQDFNCGGWAAFLDLGTNPDNTEYGQTVHAAQLIASGVANKDTASRAEIINGLLSKKKCTKREPITAADRDDNPNITQDQMPCLEERVETPAAAVADALQSAIGAGPNRVAASRGTGIQGVMTSLIVASLNRFTANAFSKGGPASGSVNGTGIVELNVSGYRVNPLGGGYDTPTNATNTIGGVTLTLGAGEALSAINNMKGNLTRIKDLIISQYNERGDFNGDLNELGACYDQVVSNFPDYSTNSEVISGRAYIQSSKSTYVSQMPTLDRDLGSVTSALSTVSGLIGQLQNSPSAATVATVSARFMELQNISDFDGAREGSLIGELRTLKDALENERKNNLRPRLERCRTLGFGR